jgi:hypothetical protein
MVELGACVVDPPNSTLLPEATFRASLEPEWMQDGGLGYARAFEIEDDVLESNIEPGTLQFWKRDANWVLLRAILQDAEPVGWAMTRFEHWLAQFKNPVLAAAPAAFDFAWVHYYWWKYLGRSPAFGHRAIDIKTLAWTLMGKGYKSASKSAMAKAFPECFTESLPHTHRALDDAVEQAYLLKGLLARANERRDLASKISKVRDLLK